MQVPFSWSLLQQLPPPVSGQGGRSRSPTGGLSFPPGLQIPEEIGAETGMGRAGWRSRAGQVAGFILRSCSLIQQLQLNSIHGMW